MPPIPSFWALTPAYPCGAATERQQTEPIQLKIKNSAMAGTFELKRLWKKYREYRITKKQRSSQESPESSSRDSKDTMILDEATVIIVGLGVDSKREEEYIEYILDDGDPHFDSDPRFVGNPYGIGCSRTYEEPYDGGINSVSISPASIRPLMPQEMEPIEDDRLLSPSKLGVWRSESIDMVKGKRKGRMPGDSADDRYKFLLDGTASRSKISAKRFSLVRQRPSAR